MEITGQVKKQATISLWGPFYMLLSALGFVLMNFMSKLMYMEGNINQFEIVYYRGVSLFLFNLFYALVNHIDILGIPKNIALPLFLRTIFGSIGIILQFTSNIYLPLSIGASLFYIYPIATSVGAFFFLKEKLSKLEIVGLFLAFIGVVCIVSATEENIEYGDIKLYQYLYPLLNAMCSVSVYLITRKIGVDVHFIVIPTWFGVMQSFIATPMWMALRRSNNTPLIMDTNSCIYCALMCFGTWVGQIFFNRALQIEKAGRMAAISYIQIPLTFFCDIFYLDLHFSWQVIIGSILIISCSFLISLLRLFSYIK